MRAGCTGCARTGVSTAARNSQPVEPLCPKRLTVDAQRAPAPAPARPLAQPLTATETRLHLTVSREFLAKLDQARLALSHSEPSVSAEAVLSTALDLLLAHDAKKKALVARPRARKSPALVGDPDRIPAEVRRAVWKRDRGCCQWALAGGGVCGSRYRCEIDHLTPRGQGGESTEANCRVLCRRHNLLAARQA